MSSIYGLYDADGCLRYIGKANNPAERLKSHMREVRRRRTPLYDWLRKHGQPEMRVLEANSQDWKASERRLITEARARGERLLNLADGGDEPLCTPEVRKANGRKMQSHPNTIAQRKENGKRLMRRIRGEEPYADAATYTREQLIRDTFNRVLYLAQKRGSVRSVENTKAAMREQYARDPAEFKEWANV